MNEIHFLASTAPASFFAEMTLFVPDISEANRIKRSFYKNPQRLYSVILAGATGDNDMIRSALEELK